MLACGLLLLAQLPLSAARDSVAEPPRMELLKDVAITHVDGTYLLTGTAGTLDGTGKPDYHFNRGVPLFTSPDLKRWTPAGYIWDRKEHHERTNGRPKIGIWMDWSAPGEVVDGLLSQASTFPRLYQIGSDWFVLCSMNQQNLIVQKSLSGKPEGPYDDYAYLATRAPDASLFFDEDGSIHLVYGEGWIAPVQPDLKALKAKPVPLATASAVPGAGRLFVGERGGVALFRRSGQYQLLAPRHRVVDGKPSHDAVLWVSDALTGPYRETDKAITGSGPVSVFKIANGDLMAVSALPTGSAGFKFYPVPVSR